MRRRSWLLWVCRARLGVRGDVWEFRGGKGEWLCGRDLKMMSRHGNCGIDMR